MRPKFDHTAYALAQRKQEEAELRKAQLHANLRHVAGVLIGLCILRPFGLRYHVDDRMRFWLCSSANAAADGKKQPLWIRFNCNPF